MNTLKTEFTKRGWNHRQVLREGDLAIYERWQASGKGQSPHFETIKIKSHNGYTLAGNFIEPAEMYPSDEDFGSNGWSLPTLDAAKAKLELLKAI